jgi:cell fate regulator YaaT (PSP1 superfamily)
MGWICAIVFQRNGRLFYADPGDLDPKVGDKVLYPTSDGPEVAEVIWGRQYSTEDIGGLPVLEGVAGDTEIDRSEISRRKRADARVAARKLIREHGLPMKVSGIDHVVEDNRTTIYFTAPDRVDFRGLVRDLGATLKCRVELRQLSARDEARLTSGVGSCGRELCCSTFLLDFEPVSVRMAKAQNLPLNPMRISGACGKLMCCLKYEHPMYQDFANEAPALGEDVDTPEGPGTVVGHNVPGEKVVVRMAADGKRTSCALASVCSSRIAFDGSPSAADTPAAADGVSTNGEPADRAELSVGGGIQASRNRRRRREGGGLSDAAGETASPDSAR